MNKTKTFTLLGAIVAVAALAVATVAVAPMQAYAQVNERVIRAKARPTLTPEPAQARPTLTREPAQALVPLTPLTPPPPTTSNTQTANVCGSALAIALGGSGCVNNQQFQSDFDFTG